MARHLSKIQNGHHISLEWPTPCLPPKKEKKYCGTLKSSSNRLLYKYISQAKDYFSNRRNIIMVDIYTLPFAVVFIGVPPHPPLTTIADKTNTVAP
jgi:hypothetical protein